MHATVGVYIQSVRYSKQYLNAVHPDREVMETGVGGSCSHYVLRQEAERREAPVQLIPPSLFSLELQPISCYGPPLG